MRKFILLCLLLLSTYAHANEIINWKENTYEVISQIGDGDKAIVYHVKDQNAHSFALKKFYSRGMFSYPEVVLNAMFDHEGRSLLAEREYNLSQQLEHANLIKIYDLLHVLNSSQTLDTYLVMEYVDGQTLRMTPSKSHSKLKALQNVFNFIDALKYCYSLGLVHQDLHSTNMMFDTHSNVKIIDLESFEEISSLEEFELDEYMDNIKRMAVEILDRGNFTEEEWLQWCQFIYTINNFNL